MSHGRLARSFPALSSFLFMRFFPPPSSRYHPKAKGGRILQRSPAAAFGEIFLKVLGAFRGSISNSLDT